MTWFSELTGFTEGNPAQVRSRLQLDGRVITSLPTGRRMQHGTLTTPRLSDLRAACAAVHAKFGAGVRKLRLRELVADVKALHADSANAGAVFQVASQFNLLEMVGPKVSPAAGVSIYENDRTQGPACAIACGAATLYRQYFVPVAGQVGQTAAVQIDCLRDLGAALGNDGGALWEMRNGYVLPSRRGLAQVSGRIAAADEDERDRLRGLLSIGVHEDAEVTVAPSGHTVCQALCTALPVAYCMYSASEWEPFARLVLEASYEAVLCAAVAMRERTGCSKVYLTLLGGGAFGNEESWIIDSLRRAVRIFRDTGLDVFVVSYGKSQKAVRDIVKEFSQA